MMKRSGWKRIVALLAGIVTVASLAACGSQGDDGTAAGGSASESRQEESLVSGSTEESLASESREEQPSQSEGAQEEGTDGSQTEGVLEQPAEDVEGASAKDQSQPSAEAGKTLVVYYSATGHTENVAGYIAAATDADIFVLEPVEPYSSDDLDWTDENSRVTREHENEEERNVELVATTVEDWESYDTVFIGYPIWWHIAAWPVDGFIAANDFTGKTVIPFCTSSSSGLGESGELLAEAAGTGNWLEGERFSSGVSEEAVQEWVESLNLGQ